MVLEVGLSTLNEGKRYLPCMQGKETFKIRTVHNVTLSGFGHRLQCALPETFRIPKILSINSEELQGRFYSTSLEMRVDQFTPSYKSPSPNPSSGSQSFNG